MKEDETKINMKSEMWTLVNTQLGTWIYLRWRCAYFQMWRWVLHFDYWRWDGDYWRWVLDYWRWDVDYANSGFEVRRPWRCWAADTNDLRSQSVCIDYHANPTNTKCLPMSNFTGRNWASINPHKTNHHRLWTMFSMICSCDKLQRRHWCWWWWWWF